MLRVKFSNKTKSCKLWAGSMEEAEHKYMGGISIETLAGRQERRWKADDITPDEGRFWMCLDEDLRRAQEAE